MRLMRYTESHKPIDLHSKASTAGKVAKSRQMTEHTTDEAASNQIWKQGASKSRQIEASAVLVLIDVRACAVQKHPVCVRVCMCVYVCAEEARR